MTRARHLEKFKYFDHHRLEKCALCTLCASDRMAPYLRAPDTLSSQTSHFKNIHNLVSCTP